MCINPRMYRCTCINMTSIFYPFQKCSCLSIVFWKYLFIPDILVKVLFFNSAAFKEFITQNIVIYYLFWGLTVISCIYFPIMYVITWRKASAYGGQADWSVLAKIYVILSFSSSHIAFILAGSGRLFVFQ